MDRRAPRLVVGYDGSDSARVAVDHAVGAAAPDGEVVVVWGYGPPPDWLEGDEFERVVADHRKRAETALGELEAAGEFGDVAHELELADSAPIDAILAAMKAHDADGVVVGSRGFSFVGGGLGSVSHELLVRSDRPVTVIPPACVAARTGAAQGETT
jgi:nucleotide-binding universal stress UspA family protein